MINLMHHRRSIRIKGYDYTSPGAYFFTICTHQRREIFGLISDGKMNLSMAGKIAHRELDRLASRFHHIRMLSFVVMPNHIHTLIQIIDPSRGTAGDERSIIMDESRRAPTAGDEISIIMDESRRAPTAGDERSIIMDESRRAPTVERFGRPVTGSIPTIIRSYKASVSWRVNRLHARPSHPVWQRNYYEHIVRDEKGLCQIHAYIFANPLRWDEDRINPSGRVKARR
jgi:putative transposase